jgi:hypothetical protein
MYHKRKIIRKFKNVNISIYRKAIRDKGLITLGCDAAFCTFRGKKIAFIFKGREMGAEFFSNYTASHFEGDL